MIVYTSKECTLQIPKGLGNFAAESVDIEPLSGSVIELSATTVTLSGAVETLNKSVDSQGNAIADLLLDVDGLDTRVSGNTEDIAALSTQTTANTAHIETLSASTVAMNNSVTANTANIATLSGITSGLAVSVETLGKVKEDIYVYLKDLNAMTTEEKKTAWKALEEKYLAGHSIYLVAKSTTTMTTDIILPLAKYQPHTEGDTLTGYFGFSVIDGGGNAFYDVTFWQRGVILGNSGQSATRKEMYKLPKASSNKLGGIKVGSGLTMSGDFLNLEIGEGLGFSGNTLVVSGGGSKGNYLIVNSLSDITDPYEGLEAYVKERTEHLEYTGYTIDASQISEGYVAHIYYDGANEKPVYRSGEAFHWEWDNNITDKFIDKKDFYYKINSAHTVFTVLLVNPAAYVTFEAGVTTATTSGTIDIFHKAVTYRYNGTEWEEYQPPKVYYLNEMTQAERADLYNEIFRYTETTFPAGNYRFFVTNEGNDEYQGRFEVFVARFYQGDNISFSGLMQSRYNKVLLQRGYKLTPEGNFNSEFSENTEIRGAGREIEINITSGGTIIGDDFNDLYQFLLYHTNNSEAVLAPFPVLFRTAIPDSGETCYAGTVETYTVWHSTTQNSHNYIIFTSKVEWNGRTRVGKWKLWYDEQGWHTQTLYWGWLMNGLVCVYDNEYANWSQTEKEEWYDRIIEECWNYDNTSFGLIRVSDKTSSADTGYNQMRVSYSIYRLESIEAGYNSLHFSGSEKDGDAPAERVYSARIARGGSIEYWEKRVDLSKLDNIYDSFIVAQYDNDNKSLTGITHNTKATIWESYKAERNEGFARKTIVAYVHTGDVVPARFNLISVDGNMEQNESGVKLHFGAVYNSVADSSLHSVRFSLSKNVETNVYTIGDIVEYSYTAS